MKCLSAVLAGWGLESNKDGTNHVSADEIMVVCAQEWNAIKIAQPELMEDFVSEIFGQFMDMNTGLCPQGRTIRLWQIANIYVQWHPKLKRV